MIKPLLPTVLETKCILRKEIPSHISILSLKSNTLTGVLEEHLYYPQTFLFSSYNSFSLTQFFLSSLAFICCFKCNRNREKQVETWGKREILSLFHFLLLLKGQLQTWAKQRGGSPNCVAMVPSCGTENILCHTKQCHQGYDFPLPHQILPYVMYIFILEMQNKHTAVQPQPDLGKLEEDAHWGRQQSWLSQKFSKSSRNTLYAS